MIIVWTYGAIYQHQGYSPILTWSGTVTAIVDQILSVVAADGYAAGAMAGCGYSPPQAGDGYNAGAVAGDSG